MKVPIAKIGEIQRIDIKKSTGIKFYDNIARICTVVKKNSSYDNRSDTSPYRMAELFGGSWEDYNNHFIVQAAGCPLKCPYCYVDNLKPDFLMTADELVDKFIDFKKKAEPKFKIKLKVFHFMGGVPAAYPAFWKELRKSLDKKGLEDIILFSDVILVEDYFFKKKPWRYLNLDHFIVTGCLKGTNKENFLKNTGFDLFEQSMKELEKYLPLKNFYLTLIEHDDKDLEDIYKIMPEQRIDYLKIINYEVTKKNKVLQK